MFKHCNQKFKPYEVWYLYDNKGFYERSLELGRCPVCKKEIAELKEKRKSDDKIFTQLAVGKDKVEKLTKLNVNRVNYSSQDVKVKRCKVVMPKWIRSGENKIIIKGGKKYQRMNAVSHFGYKECLCDIPIKEDTEPKKI